ncbi:hypothetical protein KSD_43420 [Ktedonobacter sp. SOSP1-85]|uniref:hypothetical protein n=1 Tax=Ktedonobacter sp. SOSP1-85 TaxID=2778367 RepID=UPI0019169BDA|nr:hypothetical protein [Ktedonobacter sp. SOSP1-85]GHO76571.1 hypothetical protein KSD_43420 [Ktedonobacter sp. SOSP1-85]
MDSSFQSASSSDAGQTAQELDKTGGGDMALPWCSSSSARFVCVPSVLCDKTQN